MKVIWIATTCVLFFSMFVNSTEISLNHESDSLLETDADSVQADDHHHRIEKRSGSRPVPGYSEMKGDCGGHDIANVKATLQECAARCSGMGHCKGFLYVHQAQNYRWHRCWLKRRLCNNPRHPKGQVVSVYAKAGASAGKQVFAGERSKKFPAYTFKRGICKGDYMFRPISLSIDQCAAKCKTTAKCQGFAYLLPSKAPYSRRCGLKKKICPSPIYRKGMRVMTFKKENGGAQADTVKSVNGGQSNAQSNKDEVAGYSTMKGDCGGHDIANVKASLEECAAKCSGMGQCKGFLYVHQAKNYRWHRCWLKKKLCSKPRHPAGQVVNVYIKSSKTGAVAGYSTMKGDCGGHDIANVKASLQECAAKCSGMGQCKGFLYVHQAKNYRWHRCWLKKKLCSKPRHPAGQVVNVYIKSSKTGAAPASQPKVASPTNKVEPVGQEGRRITKAPKKVPVKGYTERPGDCRGKNIANIKVSVGECGANCNKIRECAGFLYIHRASNYPYHRCWLKRTLCKTPFHPPGQHVSVYTKEKERVEEKKASLDRYREVLGQCEGNNLHRFMAKHWECAEQCSLRSECAGWSYVLKDEAKIWQKPPCLLKKVMCVKPVITPGLLIKSYFKNGVAHPTKAPATPAPPAPATPAPPAPATQAPPAVEPVEADPMDEEIEDENDVPTQEDAAFEDDYGFPDEEEGNDDGGNGGDDYGFEDY